jgi:hypothetical protein
MRRFPFYALLLISVILIGCDPSWPYKPTAFVLPDAPVPADAFISKTSVAAFTGTTDVVLLYTLQPLSGGRPVYWVNFNDSTPTPRKLAKPANKADWDADSPQLSPDKALACYYVVNPLSSRSCAAYVQRLDTAATPILIAEPGSDPHFFTDSTGGLWVSYTDTTGKLDDSLSAINHGTYKQQINPASGEKIGGPIKIADMPFYAGISKDGKYIGTGYASAHLYNLSTKTLSAINPGKQTCNPSICPDPAHGDRLMFLNIAGVQNINSSPFGSNAVREHQYVFIVDASNSMVDNFDVYSILSFPTGSEWQDPEWSSSPDFFCSLASTGDGKWDCYLVSILQKTALQLNAPEELRLDETSTPYVYIGGAAQ